MVKIGVSRLPRNNYDILRLLEICHVQAQSDDDRLREKQAKWTLETRLQLLEKRLREGLVSCN